MSPSTRLRVPEYILRYYRHDILRARAALLLRTGRTDAALAELARAAALIESDPLDDLLAAIVLARTGRGGEAKTRLAKAMGRIAADARTAYVVAAEGEARRAQDRSRILALRPRLPRRTIRRSLIGRRRPAGAGTEVFNAPWGSPIRSQATLR